MNSEAPDQSATTIGAPHTKLFARRAGREQRDLSDPFVVAELASDLIGGKMRGVTMVSTEEMRAIAKLAFGGFIVTALAVELAMLSDADAPKAEIHAALERAVERAREFPGWFACSG